MAKEEPTDRRKIRRGGGGLTREKVRGARVHKAGSKIPPWLTVSPVYKLYLNTRKDDI